MTTDNIFTRLAGITSQHFCVTEKNVAILMFPTKADVIVSGHTILVSEREGAREQLKKMEKKRIIHQNNHTSLVKKYICKELRRQKKVLSFTFYLYMG